MVPPTTPPTKSSGQGRHSILGRLSLSPSHKGQKSKTPDKSEDPPLVPQKHGARSAWAPERIPVAGPSYESMHPQTPPRRTDASNGQRIEYSGDHQVSNGGVGKPWSPLRTSDSAYLSSQSENRLPAERTARKHPPTQPVNPSTSPPRSRNPIYPALASPPRTYPAAVFPSPPFRDSPASAERPPVLKVDTTSPGMHPRTSSSSRTITRSSPVSPTQSPRHLHIIASSRSPQGRESLETMATSPQRTDKQGRPMMSTRRSAASSSRTVTQLYNGPTVSAPPSLPASPPSTRQIPPRAIAPTIGIGQGLTEAGAYARAMTSTLTRSESAQTTMTSPKSSHKPDIPQSRPDRPLPRPPGQQVDTAPPFVRAPGSDFQSKAGSHLASVEPSVRMAQTPSETTINSSPTKRPSRSHPPVHQSPSKDQSGSLVPRQQTKRANSKGPIAPSDVPFSQSQASPHPQIQRNGTLSSPTASRRRPSVLQRPSGRLQLDFLLAHPAIQSSLLGAIGINTFLSLSGSSENVRRQFTGESVGRWVLGEWTVVAPEQAGNRWPNLTVWEGFLESLLHDPATYSTYPSRWHNLLRHLSLSHTLVVLYLRSLPQSCYPNHSLLPFEDDGSSASNFPFSPSSASLSSMGQARSRVGSVAGSDAGSVAPSRAPRRERVVEIVMPEPLAAKPPQEANPIDLTPKPMRRRGSISSLASVATFSFGRRRSNSLATEPRLHVGTGNIVPVAEPAASLAPGKAGLPPVSYPSAKRYGFRNASDVPGRKRIPSESRPGSLYSFQTSPSVASYMPRTSQMGESRLSGLAGAWPLQAPPPIGVRPRSSFGSVDSNRRSDLGSPVQGRRPIGPLRCEPAFDKPMPYIPGRAPVLRVFIPLSEKVRKWPSAEGAAAAIEELEKCGALKRMKLGDLVVNTAIRAPKTTEHVLLYVPFVKHLLVPLQYTHIPTGHLPSYVDAFALPPSYYYPFLPASQIIFLNLGPYRDQGLQSMRLASDRRDMTVASGARISAKRYLYVTGVEIGPNNKAAPEWHGMVSLEAEGTAEGKAELERRFGTGHPSSAPLAPWEIVKEKSMGGTVWLRLTKERTT